MLGSRRARALVSAAVAVGLLGPLVAPSPAGATPHPVPLEQIVVKLASSGEHADAVLSPIAGQSRSAPHDRYVLTLQEGEAAAALAKLRSDPRVAYADRVRRMHADVVPDDPCYAGTGTCPVDGGGSPNQPNLAAVNAPQAWAVTMGNPNLAVAVIDTGVDTMPIHPDLVGKVTSGPTICTAPGEVCVPGVDKVGHGTHVSGIIGAFTNNTVGIAGLGWHTKVYMIKALDDPSISDPRGGGGTTADIATAIYDAVNGGFRVINMSLSNDPCSLGSGDCGPDPDTQAAVGYAIDHGVVVVAAAGNARAQDPAYPAGYPGVLSVAAADNNRVVTDFSNFGPSANIAAPGLNILSTFNDGKYAIETGTSMAAPHVA